MVNKIYLFNRWTHVFDHVTNIKWLLRPRCVHEKRKFLMILFSNALALYILQLIHTHGVSNRSFIPMLYYFITYFFPHSVSRNYHCMIFPHSSMSYLPLTLPHPNHHLPTLHPLILLHIIQHLFPFPLYCLLPSVSPPKKKIIHL